MSDRPRTVWIGTDTPFILEEFRNETTGQLLIGISTATLKIFDGTDDTLISNLAMNEVAGVPGSYEVLVPATQTGLAEGAPLRLQFDISGGPGLTLRLDARGIARVMKDDGL